MWLVPGLRTRTRRGEPHISVLGLNRKECQQGGVASVKEFLYEDKHDDVLLPTSRKLAVLDDWPLVQLQV